MQQQPQPEPKQRPGAPATAPAPRLAPAPEAAASSGVRQRVRDHFASWWPVWVAFAATRLGVLVVGLLSEYAARGRGIEDVLPFAQAGTFIHYADVVQNGYTLTNATSFPLLPALMAGLSQLGVPLAAASLLIVNVAFLFGLLGFAMLGQRYVGRQAALHGALYLAIFPVAHFFSIASTESLMLATLCGAALLALRGTPASWLGAGVLAAACALTRPPAMFVGFVLLGIAVAQLRKGSLTRRSGAAALAAMAAVPAAVVAFFLYLQVHTGDFFAARNAQEDFGREMSPLGPLHAVTGAVESVRGGSLGPGFELGAAVMLAAAITWFALRAAGDRWEVRGWTAFAAASLLLPLSTGIVWQMPRFGLLMLPVFWALGVVGTRYRWLHHAMLVLFPMALAFKVVFEVVGVTQ